MLPSDFQPSFGNFDVYGDEQAKTVIVTYGRCFSFACSAAVKLAEQGVPVKILKLNRIKPIDSNALTVISGTTRIFFFEEGVRSAGVGEKFALLLLEAGSTAAYYLTAVDDCFVEQATVKDQLEKYRLDEAGIVSTVLGSGCNASKEET